MWQNDFIIFDDQWLEENGQKTKVATIKDPQAAERYIYLIIKNELNLRGEDGWEPYHVLVEDNAMTYFVKRWVPGD